MAATFLALKTLAARAIESAFDLSFGGLAVGASLHVKRYNTVRASLDSPVVMEALLQKLLLSYNQYLSSQITLRESYS